MLMSENAAIKKTTHINISKNNISVVLLVSNKTFLRDL